MGEVHHFGPSFEVSTFVQAFSQQKKPRLKKRGMLSTNFGT